MRLEKIEDKIAWLRRWRDSSTEATQLYREIEELETAYTAPAFVIDGMPHAPGHRDLSDFAARLDGLLRRLKIAWQSRLLAHDEISYCIEHCETLKESHRALLRYYFLMGRTYEDTAALMGLSYSRIMDLRAEALQLIEIDV